jgi:GPH family glycoside/pentoside/hexuronide:cation symporter
VPKAKPAAPAPKLSLAQKLSYGVGQFGWASKDTCFHYFLFFYYTQFLGLSASLAGFAALLALIADGISDPIIGQLSDNWRIKKWGRRHPFMIAAIVPYAAALIAIFHPPADLSEQGLFAWYLVFAITVRTFLTLFTVPHMALGADLSQQYEERTSIAVFRNFLGYCGGLSIQVVAWFLIIPAATLAGDTAEGYRNVGIFAAALAMCGMLAAIIGTRSRIPLLRKTSSAQQGRAWYYAFKDIWFVVRQRSASILFFGALILTTKVGVSNTMLLHVNTFLYGFSSEQVGVFMLVIFLALFPASWLAIQGTHRYGKRNTIVSLIVLEAVIAPIPIIAHLYGYTPASGSTALLFVVCIFVVLNQSFYIAAINVGAAMIPEVVDEMELDSGLRQEGVLNSAMMLTQKVTFGLGTFIAGLAIDFVGLEGITSAADVSRDMLLRLGWLYGPTLMLLPLLGAWVYSHYHLSRDRVATIQLELDARGT